MRFKNYYSITAILLLATLLHSCSVQLYKPLAENHGENYTFEQLVEGRKIYVQKCGNCHSLHKPSKHDEQGWIHTVNKMQKRAHVTDEEKELILKYLTHEPVKKST